MPPKRSNRRRGRGFRVVGPGFYLWDLDPREALGLAAELRQRFVPPARVRRAARRPPPSHAKSS